MKVVLDTNVLMACLIKDSIVRETLFLANAEFFLPQNALEELAKYSDLLCKKGNYSQQEFEQMLDYLLEKISIVPNSEIKGYLNEAEIIMKDIDINDSVFIATALAVNADGIWSFDKDFRRQKKIKIFEIKDLIE